MVASIRTWRLTLARTLSRNSWILSCCREVARTINTPASGLTITDAASLKFTLGADRGAAPGAPGAAEGGCTDGWTAPAGNILSVSCRMSLMFFSSVDQNLLSDVLRTTVIEPFAPLACAA